MRNTLMTAALLLALSRPAFAGEMHTPPAPVPLQANTVQEPETQATIEDGTQGTFQNSVTQTALELLGVLPSLF
jgi:hypothetical protein